MRKIYMLPLLAGLFLLTTPAQSANTVVVIPMGRTVNIEAPIEWKGQWLDGANYTEGDGLQYIGSSYICVGNHTASIANAPPNSYGYARSKRRSRQYW